MPRQKKIDLSLPHTLAASLECKFESGNRVELSAAGRSLCSEDKMALMALACFDGPTEPLQVIERLQQSGADPADWRRRMMKWVASGVLLPPDSAELPVASITASYDGLESMFGCLNDRARTLAALEGIARTVRPGDRVVDIGTGSGILAFAALRAGAEHVYAIEPTPMAGLARSLAEENCLADRLTVLRGYSQDITLPETCDVMISELVSQDPFSENMLGVTADARARLLKPDARIVTAKLRLYAQLVSHPGYTGRLGSSAGEVLSDWERDYGFSFRAVAKLAERVHRLNDRQRSGRGKLVEPRRAEQLTVYSAAQPVAEIDLATDFLDPDGVQSWAFTLRPKAEVESAAVLTFYELDYGGGSLYCNGPGAHAGPAMRRPRLFVDEKLEALSPGQAVSVRWLREGVNSKLVFD